MCLTAASLKGMLRPLLSIGSVSRFTPVAKPFWSLCGFDTPPFASSPLGGGMGLAAFQRLMLSIVARWLPHCSFLSAFWKFRSQVQWSSLNCHFMPNFEPLVIV